MQTTPTTPAATLRCYQFTATCPSYQARVDCYAPDAAQAGAFLATLPAWQGWTFAHQDSARGPSCTYQVPA